MSKGIVEKYSRTQNRPLSFVVRQKGAMTVHKKTIYIILAVALAIVVVVMGVRFFLHEHLEQYYEWSDEVKSTGPWADQAIWISDDKDIYLICVQEQPNE